METNLKQKLNDDLKQAMKKGDTLMGLAKKFNAYRDSISVINHIWKPSELKAGHHILVLLNRRNPDQNIRNCRRRGRFGDDPD